MEYKRLTARGRSLCLTIGSDCLDGGGQIGFAEWIDASTDEEAISKAYELRPHAHRCEIWLKTRLVARFSKDGQIVERFDAWAFALPRPSGQLQRPARRKLPLAAAFIAEPLPKCGHQSS